MSAHLLPVTAVWLARLPDGTPLRYGLGSGAKHHGCKQEGHAHGIRCYLLRLRVGDSVRVWLDMSDTLTAAAVAARIVRPWLDVTLDTSSVLAVVLGSYRPSAVLGVVEAAERMQPLTPADLDILARLARAAMEGA